VGRESRKAKGQANESEAGADEPDPGDSGGEASRVIKVSQIRDLTIHAAYAPREGKWRVLSVDPADRMNASAQNALLKTLEEPPGRAVLILVTSRPHMLLPTVRSRCLSVRFAAMPVPDLAARLEALGFDRAEALMRAALAGGRAGAALRLKLAEVRDRREAVLATLEGLARDRGALAELGRANALLLGDGEESTLLEGLDLIEAILRDAALSASRAPASALVHADLAPRIEALGLRLGRSRAATLVRAVERLRADLRFNPNEKIMADCLWAAIAGGPVP
jgi:DNA polymerase-3 subunit delta'